MEKDMSTLGVELERLIREDEFKRLLEKKSQFNIFRVLGNANYEIRHSNVLAWLLDSTETHRVGGLFTERFIERINTHYAVKLRAIHDKYKDANNAGSRKETITISSKKVDVFREKDNIDIVACSTEPSAILAIENKVWSCESKEGQLVHYREVLEKKYPLDKQSHYLLFLTPDGEQSQSDEMWLQISHKDIYCVLEGIFRHFESPEVASFIDMYLNMLEEQVLNNSTLDTDETTIIDRYMLSLFSPLGKLDSISEVLDRMLPFTTEKGYRELIIALTNQSNCITKNACRGYLNRKNIKGRHCNHVRGSGTNFETSRLQELNQSLGLNHRLIYHIRHRRDCLQAVCYIQDPKEKENALFLWFKDNPTPDTRYQLGKEGRYLYFDGIDLLSEKELSSMGCDKLKGTIEKKMDEMWSWIERFEEHLGVYLATSS